MAQRNSLSGRSPFCQLSVVKKESSKMIMDSTSSAYLKTTKTWRNTGQTAGKTHLHVALHGRSNYFHFTEHRHNWAIKWQHGQLGTLDNVVSAYTYNGRQVHGAIIFFFSPMPCAPWQLRRSFKLAYYSHTTQKISLVREATNKTPKKQHQKHPKNQTTNPQKHEIDAGEGETLRTSPTQRLSQMFSSVM